MGLPRQHMAEVKFYRTEIGHSHLKIFFDKLHVLLYVGLCPTDDDGVLSHVFLVAHLDHFLGDPQRNTCFTWVRGATGSEDQLAHLTGMIERQQLSYPSAHGMAADNRTFKTQLIHNGYRIISEQVSAIIRGGFAGQAGTTIVENDHAVIASKLGDLVDLPHRSVTGGFTQEKKRCTLTRYLVIDIHSIVCFHVRHEEAP